VAPGLDERVGSGKPASTPPVGEMWAAWRAVTAAADAYLDALTPALLETHLKRDGAPVAQSVGTLLLRNLYHYWFHTGEASAVRQMLGHRNLPDFVGDMTATPYRRSADRPAWTPGVPPDGWESSRCFRPRC
jgi:hypothetical protein